MPSYVRYREDLENYDPDEAETFHTIIDMMTQGMHTVRGKTGENVRISHAKAYGFLKGELVVDDNLPPELAQGLFAVPARYDVVVRVSAAPGEILDDSKVNTSRGMAVKVLNVPGPKLAGHENNSTQDFVFENGKVFIVGNAKSFVQAFKPNAKLAPHLSDTTKGVVSRAAELGNKALHAVGLDSVKLDFYGHPKFHPMGEAHYSQCPLRYGDYVAKMSFTPSNPPLEALYEKVVDLPDKDSLRQLTIDYFKTHPAEFAVNVQLCTDLNAMPIEDANVEWPEDQSPYRRVATLRLPVQDAFDPAVQDTVDHEWSFSPAHTLATHRPLGSVMRARLAVYPALADRRRRENGRPQTEPASGAGLA